MPKKDRESIIPQKKPSECYFCKRPEALGGLEHHHCFHGTGQRELARQDGLWIWICTGCHTGRNDSVHLDPNRIKDRMLQTLAQDCLIKEYMRQGYPKDVARQMFRDRYGRFYDN